MMQAQRHRRGTGTLDPDDLDDEEIG